MNDRMKTKYLLAFCNSVLKTGFTLNVIKKIMIISNIHAAFKGICCLT